ncbi:integrase core domain-containing protein [Micromonospora sp. U56]|nr:integrase core domain-containing protein [Micromonospora sp. U56]
MGSIGDCYDNSMVESFFGSMQLELLDRQAWATRQELANAIFEYFEAWYNPRRRHSSLGNLSPIDYERHHIRPQPRPDHQRRAVRETGGSSTAGQRRRCFGLLRSAGDVWACALEVNAWRRRRRDVPLVGYQELCRELTASGPGTFAELDSTGARSVLRRFSDAWFAAANAAAAVTCSRGFRVGGGRWCRCATRATRSSGGGATSRWSTAANALAPDLPEGLTSTYEFEDRGPATAQWGEGAAPPTGRGIIFGAVRCGTAFPITRGCGACGSVGLCRRARQKATARWPAGRNIHRAPLKGRTTSEASTMALPGFHS